MEILVLGIGELIALPVSIAATAMVSVIGGVISFVIRLFFLPVEVAVEAAIDQIPEKKESDDAELRAKQKLEAERHRKIVNGILIVCSTILVLILLVVFIANAFFFAPTMKAALWYVKTRTQVEIDFDQAKGNLWTGYVQLHGATVKRQNHPVSQFDLKADLIEIDISIWSLISPKGLFNARVVESLKISKLHGKWDQHADSQKKKKGKKRKHFRIDDLQMNDLQFDYTDHTRPREPLKVVLKVDSLESKPLRSYLALFDVLFKSNIFGSVNGIPYRFEKFQDDNHFGTRWACDDLPIDILASYFGMPFNWFDAGKVDMLIVNKAANNDAEDSKIVMNWSLVFKDFHAKAPEGTSLKAKATAASIILFMNKHSKKMPLQFDFQLKNDDYSFDSSPQWREFYRIMFGEVFWKALKNYVDEKLKEKDEK